MLRPYKFAKFVGYDFACLGATKLYLTTLIIDLASA